MLDKRCTICREMKPLTAHNWHADSRVSGGFRAECKLCRKEKSKAVVRENPYCATQSLECKKCKATKPKTSEFWLKQKTSKSGLRLTCKPCLYADLSERYKSDSAYREKRLASVAKHRLSNIEDGRRRARQWCLENTYRHRENVKKWMRANPIKAKAISRASRAGRRAREALADGKHSAEDLRSILLKQNNACYWCDSELSELNFSVDHYVPLSRGGSNWPDNIVASCKGCNSAKRDKFPDEFLAYLAARKAQ